MKAEYRVRCEKLERLISPYWRAGGMNRMDGLR